VGTSIIRPFPFSIEETNQNQFAEIPKLVWVELRNCLRNDGMMEKWNNGIMEGWNKPGTTEWWIYGGMEEWRSNIQVFRN